MDKNMQEHLLSLIKNIKDKLDMLEMTISKKIVIDNITLDANGMRTEPCSKEECPSQEIWSKGKKIQ